METRNQRLAAAKKKLQEYKNQQKQKHESLIIELNTDDSVTRPPPQISDTSDSASQQMELRSSDSSSPTSTSNNGHSRSDSMQTTESVEIILDGMQETSPAELNTVLSVSPAPIPEMVANFFEVRQPSSNGFSNTTVPLDKEVQCEPDPGLVDDSLAESFRDLQNELSKVRSENQKLYQREMEFVQQLENSEKVIRDLRKEVNHFKEQGSQLNQLEDLRQAVTVLSKAKVALAEELNNEQDKSAQLTEQVSTYQEEIRLLQSENVQLKSDLTGMKNRMEEALMKNQLLEDQRRQLGTRVEGLESALTMSATSSKDYTLERRHDASCDHSHLSHDDDNTTQILEGEPSFEAPKKHHKEESSHDCNNASETHNHGDCHEGEHNHNVDEHSPEKREHIGEDPDHHHEGHNHDSSCDHSGHHSHEAPASAKAKKLLTPAEQLAEMEKTLKRLQWENATYEEELTKLGPLKKLEPEMQELREKNRILTEEVNKLEHLVIQLQGENDTIGDYIYLYQTQKLALKEHAKENEVMVEALSKERNELLQKLSQLSEAVEKLAQRRPVPNDNNEEKALEGQIRDLIHNVNTKVHEPYSCSTCSGHRMMTV